MFISEIYTHVCDIYAPGSVPRLLVVAERIPADKIEKVLSELHFEIVKLDEFLPASDFTHVGCAAVSEPRCD